MLTPLSATLAIVVAVQAAAIVALLIQRSRRRIAERAAGASAERLRIIAERAPVMIWTTRPDSRLDYLNSYCVTYTGMPIERLLGEGWLDAVHPDDRERCVATYAPAVEERVPLLMEYRIRRADGVYRWFLDTGVPRYELGQYKGFIGCTVDITERKEAEQRIRESSDLLQRSHREVQHLAGRLIEAQDAERARVARDLHDDVSQQLAGLAIAFSGLKRRLSELNADDGLEEDLRSLQQRTTTIAQSVRHLSHDLHPSVLRHAGLVPAITTYCSELERTHGTALACHADGDFGSVTAEAALCLYRIAQEALRNVIAHSGASRADIRLLRADDVAEIAVTDDGRGFDVASSLEKGNGLGLVSITERVRLAGGTVSITAEPSKGTRVCARIPSSAAVRADVRPNAERPQHDHSLF